MTLDHLNQKFLQSNPLPATPFGTALVRTIRERLLIQNTLPVYAGKEVFEWLLEMTGAAPTATTFGTRFLRITKDGYFVDVIENKALNVEATKIK